MTEGMASAADQAGVGQEWRANDAKWRQNAADLQNLEPVAGELQHQGGAIDPATGRPRPPQWNSTPGAKTVANKLKGAVQGNMPEIENLTQACLAKATAPSLKCWRPRERRRREESRGCSGPIVSRPIILPRSARRPKSQFCKSPEPRAFRAAQKRCRIWRTQPTLRSPPFADASRDRWEESLGALAQPSIASALVALFLRRRRYLAGQSDWRGLSPRALPWPTC